MGARTKQRTQAPYPFLAREAVLILVAGVSPPEYLSQYPYGDVLPEG